jgi:pimeloyl-ACP methyl ester carboxylesterase
MLRRTLSTVTTIAAPDARGTATRLDADGVALHAVRWTPTAAVPGRRVLLVHGLGAHTLSWEPAAQPLADRLGAEVVAIDLIGFGRTRAPARTATIGTQRRLVAAVLEQLGPAVVVGNSMGGSISIGVTATHPELVTALVLVNPAVPHPRPGLAIWARNVWLAPLVIPSLGAQFVASRARRLGPARLVDASLEASLSRTDDLDPDLRRRMIELTAERFEWPEVAAAYADAARSLVAYLAWGLHRDLGRAAPARPTLLLHGREDRLVSLDAARHAAHVHPLSLRVLDGIGHAPQLEDPTRVVDTVAGWLGERRLDGWDAPSRSALSGT